MLPQLSGDAVIISFAGVIDHIDPAGSIRIEFVISGAAVVRPAIRQCTHRRVPVCISDIHTVDIFSIEALECSEQAPGQLMTDGQIRGPYLWPFEIRMPRGPGDPTLL